ncbi:hypothetical protein B0H34DRAFT_691990 [Crassisporium funariophilum]|nr:hypothetical protein B0H34DRAFT_691990 [Crassisporium funariophilum]
MANARDSLKHVDGIAGTNLHARLLQADEKYLDVLNESRTAANKLYSVINTFVTVILPIAQDTQYPLAQRLEIVKSSADKIAHSAKEHLHPYDRKFSALSGNLEDLKSSLVEADKRMRKDAQEPLKDLMSEIESIEDNLKQNTKIFDRLSSKAKELISTFEEPSQLKAPASAKTPAPITPAVQSKPPPAAPKNTQEKVEGNIGTSATSSAIFTGVKMLGNFFEGEAALSAKQKELEAKVVELATTRKNIAETSAEIAAVIVEISTLIKMFSGIIGKLGHFGAIWNKVP